MNSKSIDLIYLDPPFNSNANYAAPIGSKAAGAEFKDTWSLSEINLAWHGLIKHEHPGLYSLLEAASLVHSKSMMAYLIYMAPRLMEMRRLLKTTGTVYLHCDSAASHYLKAAMDAIFGRKNYLGSIMWDKGNGSKSKKKWGNEHEDIHCYAHTFGKHTFNVKDPNLRKPYSDLSLEMHFKHLDSEGRRYRKRIVNGNEYIYYADEGRFIGNIWLEIPSMLANSPIYEESTGYPTQKPLALLQRIIRASSNPGDMVFDPFCGCATTCVAAESLGEEGRRREWVGIDISPKAAELIQDRMKKELRILAWKATNRTDIPLRTDQGTLPKYNSAKNKNTLYGEQGGYCNLCEAHFEKQHLEVDHIVPVSKGGTDHISNLQLLCGNCNRTKGARSQEWALHRLLDKGYVKQRTNKFIDQVAENILDESKEKAII